MPGQFTNNINNIIDQVELSSVSTLDETQDDLWWDDLHCESCSDSDADGDILSYITCGGLPYKTTYIYSQKDIECAIDACDVVEVMNLAEQVDMCSIKFSVLIECAINKRNGLQEELGFEIDDKRKIMNEINGIISFLCMLKERIEKNPLSSRSDAQEISFNEITVKGVDNMEDSGIFEQQSSSSNEDDKAEKCEEERYSKSQFSKRRTDSCRGSTLVEKYANYFTQFECIQSHALAQEDIKQDMHINKDLKKGTKVESTRYGAAICIMAVMTMLSVQISMHSQAGNIAAIIGFALLVFYYSRNEAISTKLSHSEFSHAFSKQEIQFERSIV